MPVPRYWHSGFLFSRQNYVSLRSSWSGCSSKVSFPGVLWDVSVGVHGMYVEDRAGPSQLVRDTSNRRFPAWFFHVLNGNQTRALIVMYFVQDHRKPLWQYHGTGIAVFCALENFPHFGLKLSAFRMVMSVFPHFRLECRFLIMNSYISECRYYFFDFKSEFLSETVHITFRRMSKARVRCVQYFYVQEM